MFLWRTRELEISSCTLLHVMFGGGSPLGSQGMISSLPTSWTYSGWGGTRSDGGSWRREGALLYLCTDSKKFPLNLRQRQGVEPYLKNDFSGFRLAHGAITVIGSAGIHANSIIIGCCYENGALWVYHPTWELEEKIHTVTPRHPCISPLWWFYFYGT